MLRLHDLHTEHIGKICKLTSFGVELEKEYELLFGIGNHYSALMLFDFCNNNEVRLMFVDEKPFSREGVIWYCLKDVGKYSEVNYHWFTMNQILICSEI